MTDRSDPDVEIAAGARARSLKVERVSDVDTRFDGDAEVRSERANLPDRVEEGVEYRDVRVAWRAGVRVRDLGQ